MPAREGSEASRERRRSAPNRRNCRSRGYSENGPEVQRSIGSSARAGRIKLGPLAYRQRGAFLECERRRTLGTPRALDRDADYLLAPSYDATDTTAGGMQTAFPRRGLRKSSLTISTVCDKRELFWPRRVFNFQALRNNPHRGALCQPARKIADGERSTAVRGCVSDALMTVDTSHAVLHE